MIRLKVPIITIVGEGLLSGALGIGVGDKVYMMENTWYSIISESMFFYFMEKLGIQRTSCRSFKIDIS
jgi:hypothetical protein